jgi:hypothetical protein
VRAGLTSCVLRGVLAAGRWRLRPCDAWRRCLFGYVVASNRADLLVLVKLIL